MFVFEETFYLIDSNEKVATVRTRTNNILKSLKDSDQELAKTIIKENKLDLSREDHLVIFFQKLNNA
jgi:sulfur relay (sulfurtransferase) DsrC/TusE family protein